MADDIFDMRALPEQLQKPWGKEMPHGQREANWLAVAVTALRLIIEILRRWNDGDWLM